MKYIFVFVISLFFLVLTYISAPEEFTLIDLAAIVFMTVFFLVLGCFVASRFVSYKIVQNLILSGLIIINLVYLHLAVNNDFMDLPRHVQLFYMFLAMFILTTLLNMFDDKLKVRYKLLPIFIIIIAGTGQILLSLGLNLQSINLLADKVEKNIKLVDFKTKPNVYFLSFDSLIPPMLLKKHLDIDDAAYHQVLDAHVRRFNNFFADNIATRGSLNSLLALDMDFFYAAKFHEYEKLFFPGLVASPLLEIFKHNGYETTTLFDNVYLGQITGSYVDNYRVNKTLNNACTYIVDTNYRAFTFMGYCLLLKYNLFQNIISTIAPKFAEKPKTDIAFLIDNMRSGLQRTNPQFLLAYMYTPGHVDEPYIFKVESPEVVEKYRQYYYQSSKTTASYFNKIITFITEEDPEAIVYIFGDHGPFLSRQDNIEQDDTFFIQDRYGVYGGIYPKNRCGEYFDQFYDTRVYMTIAQGAHVILKCLSGGENAFITEKYYPLPVSTPSHQYRYEDYLYE